MEPTGLVHGALTQAIIGAAMEVHNSLGSGFLEKVYENALAIELRSLGYLVEQQKPMIVRYKGQVVGEYLADLLVDGRVVVELKVADALTDLHLAQVLNYLRATNLEVGLLLNFHTARLQWKRVVI